MLDPADTEARADIAHVGTRFGRDLARRRVPDQLDDLIRRGAELGLGEI
jgi:hypothetical protein